MIYVSMVYNILDKMKELQEPATHFLASWATCLFVSLGEGEEMTPSFSNPCTQTRHHFLSGNKGQILCLFDISYPHSSHSSCLLKALIIKLLIIAKRLVASRRHGNKISGSQQPGNNMVT